MKRDWLIEIRKEKQITQEDLAESVGVTRQMISAIESGGNTTVKTAKKIASRLGFDWTKIFSNNRSII